MKIIFWPKFQCWGEKNKRLRLRDCCRQQHAHCTAQHTGTPQSNLVNMTGLKVIIKNWNNILQMYLWPGYLMILVEDVKKILSSVILFVKVCCGGACVICSYFLKRITQLQFTIKEKVSRNKCSWDTWFLKYVISPCYFKGFKVLKINESWSSI